MSDHAEIAAPDVTLLVTEDDAPVDSLYQEKQMRLLVEPLYSSWHPVTETGERRLFTAASDVGLFASVHDRAIVPDVLVSLDVEVPDEFWRKDRRSYYFWEFGKPPDIVIEIVSNREGDELEGKRAKYSKLRVAYYVVFDHLQLLSEEILRVYELQGDLLVPSGQTSFPHLPLGLRLWEGEFEGKHAVWLRWCLPDGTLIPTGEERADLEGERADQERERAQQERERADQERERAQQERERADQERERAQQERERAERLAEKLRELGIDPE